MRSICNLLKDKTTLQFLKNYAKSADIETIQVFTKEIKLQTIIHKNSELIKEKKLYH